MKKYSILLLLIAATFMFSACGGTKPLPKTDEGDIPEWFLNPADSPNFLIATATATSRDMQLAIDKATTDARASISRQMETELSSLQKKFDQETGVNDASTLRQKMTNAIKAVTKTTLVGSKPKQKHLVKDGSNWRAYVQMEYPLGAARQALVSAIKKDDEMYTNYKEAEAFKELEKETEGM